MGLVEESHSAFAEKAADALFSCPIFSARDFASVEGVKPKTARRLLGTLEKTGVVEELSPHSGQRSAIFYFPARLLLPRICNRDSGVIHVPQIDSWDMDG